MNQQSDDMQFAEKMQILHNSCHDAYRRSIKWRRWQSVFVVLNPWLAVLLTSYGNYAGALLQLSVGWYMYRGYRRMLRFEARWIACMEEVRRMWVERDNATLALMHSNRLDNEIEKLKQGL